jgi:hypothetical protein
MGFTYISGCLNAWYTSLMQKIATKVFIFASIAFGCIGILHILTIPQGVDDSSVLNIILMKLLLTTVFIILPSFALSVAGKYLSGEKFKSHSCDSY